MNFAIRKKSCLQNPIYVLIFKFESMKQKQQNPTKNIISHRKPRSFLLSPCVSLCGLESFTAPADIRCSKKKGSNFRHVDEACDAMEGRPSGASLISPRESRFEVNSAADGQLQRLMIGESMLVM